MRYLIFGDYMYAVNLNTGVALSTCHTSTVLQADKTISKPAIRFLLEHHNTIEVTEQEFRIVWARNVNALAQLLNQGQ